MWLSFIKNFQSFWLVHCDIRRGIIDIWGCICACYIILLISKFIAKRTLVLKKALSFLGKYSIFVLCIHLLELNLFPWTQLIQKIVTLGLPATYESYIIIIGKFMFIIPLSIICANWKFTRNLFGFNDKKNR